MKLCDFGLDSSAQRIEGLLETCDTVAQQLRCHVVDTYASFLNCREISARLSHVGVDGARHNSVVAEIFDRLRRHRIHGVRPDQRLYIKYIAVRGVLGAGAGPERTLHES